MDNDITIKVERVSKTFKLPHEKNTSIKSSVVNIFRKKRSFETQQVLNEISFNVKKGEFFGIIGCNGSGKSTLLKLLAGIYTPTEGSIKVNGTLTPFIELGVGFNPELTGNENVYLNGALLGFSRKEMMRMYDDVVAFAELENFMDQKLKNYSSGMQVRLAFSIAIRANTDILVLDEVLAVGDERFQNKCVNIFEELKANGKTIILVTHDMNSVRRFCTKAIVIHDSKLVYEGKAADAAMEYVKLNFPETVDQQEAPETIEKKVIPKSKSTIKMRTHDINGHKTSSTLFKSGDRITFNIEWRDDPRIKNLGVAIFNKDGSYVYGINTIIDNYKITKSKMLYEVLLQLGSGIYYAQVGLFGKNDSEKIHFDGKALEFRVVNNDSWQGQIKLEHYWREAS